MRVIDSQSWFPDLSQHRARRDATHQQAAKPPSSQAPVDPPARSLLTVGEKTPGNFPQPVWFQLELKLKVNSSTNNSKFSCKAGIQIKFQITARVWSAQTNSSLQQAETFLLTKLCFHTYLFQ